MAIAPLQLPGYAAPQSLDFSSLANLGQVYKQAAADRGLRDAFANGVPTDAAGLSELGARVGEFNPQLGLSLAQLGMNASQRDQDRARQARQDAFQREQAAQAQKNADRAFGLQQRQFAENQDYTPQERAAMASQYGIQQGTPEFKAFVLTGALPTGNTTVQAQTEQRKAAAASLGLTPENPAYNSYVLTGKMPREDAQPLSATDKKAILEADEHVLSANTAIDALKKAKELSPKALGFKGAGTVAGLGAVFGNQASQDTVELDNLVTSNALTQLKSIFGGNPTEGERKIMLDIQGSSAQPDAVRQRIFDRAIGLAQNRLKFNQQRSDEMRGGQFYKPQGGMQRAPVKQTQGITQQEYESLPSGSTFTAPDGTQRVKP